MPKGIYKHKSHSEKTKKKISKNNTRYWLGKKLSVEHKKKLKMHHRGMLGKNHTKEAKLKISKARKGAKFSKEHLAKLSLSHIGIKSYWKGKKRPEISKSFHWQWKGGITPIAKAVRNSLEYKLWREAIFKRDNYTCQICGKRGGDMRANHIKKFADYPELRFDLNNGITICKECDYKWIIGHEPEWESYFNFNLETRNV
ncbi:MAG: NUMOD3 domain-containing DNA-binding protein [Candidatus Omnitrophota bacterium]|jgi:hypothetical protein